MAVRIRAIQTGITKIKTAQRSRKLGGLLRIFTDTQWTEWLPIYAWLIDHPEGIIIVDTGETARTSEPGYFPSWHPYYRMALQMNVKPEDEIGVQLEHIGIQQKDVKKLVLTHFHTDHAGGLAHFPSSQILVSGADYALARSVSGKLLGYLPSRWPRWFTPTPIHFQHGQFGPFKQYFNVTQAGDVIVVPTPGHTPNHVSVIVKSEDVIYFLAGDTSYTQEHILDRIPDGVSPNAAITLGTIDRILNLARSQPLVYLPSHDPENVKRLEETRTLVAPATKQVKEAVHA